MPKLRNFSAIPVGCVAANCESSNESDKLLVNERDSECHEAAVSDSEVHKTDDVSEVRLVGDIDDEMSYVGEADRRR